MLEGDLASAEVTETLSLLKTMSLLEGDLASSEVACPPAPQHMSQHACTHMHACTHKHAQHTLSLLHTRIHVHTLSVRGTWKMMANFQSIECFRWPETEW